MGDDYEILTAKKRFNRYQANRRVAHLETRDGEAGNLSFRRQAVDLTSERKLGVTLAPYDGFVIAFE